MAPLEPSWATKITRYIGQLTHWIQQVHYKLLFTLFNEVEWFTLMQSLAYIVPYPHAAVYIAISGYYYA